MPEGEGLKELKLLMLVEDKGTRSDCIVMHLYPHRETYRVLQGSLVYLRKV